MLYIRNASYHWNMYVGGVGVGGVAVCGVGVGGVGVCGVAVCGVGVGGMGVGCVYQWCTMYDINQLVFIQCVQYVAGGVLCTTAVHNASHKWYVVHNGSLWNT